MGNKKGHKMKQVNEFKEILNEYVDVIRKQFKHSIEFLRILEQKEVDKAIRIITHSSPLLIFWISPNGKVISVKDSHYNSPPNGDKSILADKKYKGYLRGRSALIGNVIYIVIYGEGGSDLAKWQRALLRRSSSRILDALRSEIKGNKNITNNQVLDSIFINEIGNVIDV